MKDAGEFSEWVYSFTQSMNGEGAGSVPCGECVACCTSSKFILVKPSDSKALEAIPKELLFSAPGLPKGFQILGYDEQGHCPMFKEGKCSIYESRPETCRQYDCRALAAADASLEEENADISESVSLWEFSFKNADSVRRLEAIRQSMMFLRKNSELFPEGYIPARDSQKSALAIRLHEIFLSDTSERNSAKNLAEEIVKQFPIDLDNKV